MTPVQILIYLWIALTTLLAVSYFLRRRSINAEMQAARSSTAATDAVTTGDETVDHAVLVTTGSVARSESSARGEAPHPADLATPSEPDEVSEDPEPVLLGTVTTDTIEFDLPKPETTEATVQPDSTNSTITDNRPKGTTMKMDLSDRAVSTDMREPDLAPLSLPEVNQHTLMDVLDGIKLPYDLTPVTSAVEDPDRHLIFLTTHSNAEEVGTKFADEIIRLGFDFTPVGLDQAVAIRGEDVVSMSIVPKASEVEGANGPRYGSAADGDVALELWTGRGSTPPTAGT